MGRAVLLPQERCHISANGSVLQAIPSRSWRPHGGPNGASCPQWQENTIEGSEDGQTSSEMEIKLINTARGSLQELRADYLDYLNTHHLQVWPKDSARQKKMREFCREQNDYEAYAPLVGKMTDEEYANLLLTLCHQTDKMMCAYLRTLEERFVTEGGIKERMYAARTGYRQAQDTHMQQLEAENAALRTENAKLKQRLAELERLVRGE